MLLRTQLIQDLLWHGESELLGRIMFVCGDNDGPRCCTRHWFQTGCFLCPGIVREYVDDDRAARDCSCLSWIGVGGPRGQAPASLEISLNRAPERKADWQGLLVSLPAEERKGAEYLLTYMPLADLKTLPVANVREAVKLSYEARKQVAWVRKLPQAVFFDAVLPYANMTEPRQSMRTEFQSKYLPLIVKTRSPGEAALVINRILFKDYKVTYNTRRLRTDQSPPKPYRKAWRHARACRSCWSTHCVRSEFLREWQASPLGRAEEETILGSRSGIKEVGTSSAQPNLTTPVSITLGSATKQDVRSPPSRKTQSGQ